MGEGREGGREGVARWKRGWNDVGAELWGYGTFDGMEGGGGLGEGRC